ncbi:Proteasome maturation factor [Phaffia rhodozyma]|uniref:Proteasome maturation factor n=1 Tax=Phaffia rhodozyma TaxID=264483 RepID=A0A0F7SSG0_PHARH|nr:Proteasome maturation factor [Phaffia rhodozyma]
MSAPLHLAPSARSTPSVSLADTANSFGLHDTLRHGGGRNLAGEIKEDPFKRRLNEWEQTQFNLKLQMQRNAYGLGAPLRSLMDRKIISQDAALPEFSTSQFHLDILQGTDTSLDIQHFFSRAESSNFEAQNFQSQMERKHKI